MVSFCFHKFIQFLCYFIYILENDLPSDDQEEDYFELAFKSLQNTANDLQQFLKQDIEKYDREKTKQSTREHHPEWFEPVYPNEKEDGGINDKFRTKEDYFNNNFENRIKKFFKSQKKSKKQKCKAYSWQKEQLLLLPQCFLNQFTYHISRSERFFTCLQSFFKVVCFK